MLLYIVEAKKGCKKKSLNILSLAAYLLKMIKHDFLKIWGKMQIWEALKAKNLNAKLFDRKGFILTPFKDSERSS